MRILLQSIKFISVYMFKATRAIFDNVKGCHDYFYFNLCENSLYYPLGSRKNIVFPKSHANKSLNSSDDSIN